MASSVLISSARLYSAELNQPEHFKLERLFPTDTFPSVTFDTSIAASPLLYLPQGKLRIIVSASNGIIAVLDGETGALEWQINAPVPEGQQAQLISTPVMIGDKLVILYQCLARLQARAWERRSKICNKWCAVNNVRDSMSNKTRLGWQS